MKYKGKLYGCVNGAYFPLEMTSEDVDSLQEALKKKETEIERLLGLIEKIIMIGKKDLTLE